MMGVIGSMGIGKRVSHFKSYHHPGSSQPFILHDMEIGGPLHQQVRRHCISHSRALRSTSLRLVSCNNGIHFTQLHSSSLFLENPLPPSLTSPHLTSIPFPHHSPKRSNGAMPITLSLPPYSLLPRLARLPPTQPVSTVAKNTTLPSSRIKASGPPQSVTRLPSLPGPLTSVHTRSCSYLSASVRLPNRFPPSACTWSVRCCVAAAASVFHRHAPAPSGSCRLFELRSGTHGASLYLPLRRFGRSHSLLPSTPGSTPAAAASWRCLSSVLSIKCLSKCQVCRERATNCSRAHRIKQYPHAPLWSRTATA